MKIRKITLNRSICSQNFTDVTPDRQNGKLGKGDLKFIDFMPPPLFREPPTPMVVSTPFNMKCWCSGLKGTCPTPHQHIGDKSGRDEVNVSAQKRQF